MEQPTLPDKTARCLDNTKLSGYKTCPRYHFIRQLLGWGGDGTGAALVFGSSWHNGQDAIWTFAKEYNQGDLTELAQAAFLEKWEEEGFNPNPTQSELDWLGLRNPGTAHEMFYNYIEQRWKILQNMELLSCEQPFAVPLPDVENTWYVGRLDKVVQISSQTLVIEHKTTAMYATQGNFRTDYVDSWYSDAQVKGYQFGAGLYYPGLDGVWVDCALVHKKIHDAFKFIPVSHNFELLKEWLGDAQGWSRRLIADEEQFKQDGELRPGCFPKNENSCFGKYGACAFIDICRTNADPSKLREIPAGFSYKPWEPFDLLGLDKLIKEPSE